MSCRSILVGTFTAVLALWAITPARAQEPYATVAVSPELREIGADYFGGYIQVYADGKLCGELSFTDMAQRTPDGGAEFELGVADQPPDCSRTGAAISFFDGNFVGLGNRYTLSPGTRIEVAWFQVGAVRAGLDSGPSVDGRTYVTIDPGLREGGAERLGYLDVYADKELCGRFSLTDAAAFTPSGGAEFELGKPGQPAACGRDGAIISLVDSNGTRLSAVYRLTSGQRIAIQNFTIPPPHTGEQGGDAAPGAPSAGTGLAANAPRSTAQTALAITSVLLLVGALLYVVTRRHPTTG